MKANRADAYQLFQRGAVALSEISDYGIAVDVPYCKKKQKEVVKRIAHCERKVAKSELGKEWTKKYKGKTNFDSPDQLRTMLFDVFDLETDKKTKTGDDSTGAEVLESIDMPGVGHLLEMKRLGKILSTYLNNILLEQRNGIIHPDFSLAWVRTYRSSSSRPNFQNIPVRNKEMGQIVRDSFIPRPGRRLAEIDFKALEVKVSACYHKDPVMLRYIRDNYDLHLDMSCECYKLKQNQCTKETRYAGKNRFVFPEFYGAYFETVAPALWKSVDELHLETTDGVPLLDHLKEVGLGTYERFKKHIQRVEKNFWDRRFMVYSKWKRDWYEKYLVKGYFDTLTGFRCQGWMKRNDVINYPVQGSAFHCLLWTLCELHEWLEEKGFKTRIVGQIHDSIVLDIVPVEFDEVVGYVLWLTGEALADHWKWIIVPMDVELEAAPVDGTWFQKEEIKL